MFNRGASLISVILFLVYPLIGNAVQPVIGRMAIIGDAGEKGSSLNSLKKSIQMEGVNSLILPGDNLYSGTYESVWNDWKISGLKFDVVAIGNHTDGYDKEVKYFAMPAEYYSTIKYGARFIVLNSDNLNGVDQQIKWLENELEMAQENLVFLVYHHPTFTLTTKHNWMETMAFQSKLRNVLKNKGSKISAVFLGHDHISSFVNFGNTAAVVAGAGREVRSAEPVSYKENDFQIETQFLSPEEQHWSLLEIEEGSKSALVHFINVKTQKNMCTGHISHGPILLDSNCASN